MINLETCRFIVWGYTYKNYCTHTHIHEAFYRALCFMFSEDRCEWKDINDIYFKGEKEKITIKGSPFHENLIITNWECIQYIPIAEHCFYIVHGLNDHPEILEKFTTKNYLSWNVFIDNGKLLGMSKDYPREPHPIPLTEPFKIDEDFILYPNERHCEFRWATDLLPHEIEANKPTELLSLRHRVINWVGTIWWVNENELGRFVQAAKEDGIGFNHIGAGQKEWGGKKVVSIEENIKLIRESWMAPSISGSHHLTEGYAPCRIFKNISYGQMGITNNARVNEIFGGKLIYNKDAYQLYWQAKEVLQKMPIRHLHDLMDEVAKKHTYINRINAILEAVKILQ